MTAASLQELVRDVVYKVAPSLIFAGVHGYTVSRDNGDGTLDLAPMPRVLHGPKLRVEQWAAPGIEAGINVGDKVLLVFASLGDDEVMPVIIGHVALRNRKPASLKVDATGTLRAGASASLVHLGSGTEQLAIGVEVATSRPVVYGNNVQIPVVGAFAVGPIIQNPATAPNAIAKVRT